MVNHIKFCLEEIEAEIEALDRAIVSARDRASLAIHIAGLRVILDGITEGGAAHPDTLEPVLALVPGPSVSNAVERVQAPADRFSLIRGVTTADLDLLALHGITSFAAIAQWRRADIEQLGGKQLFQRIAREGWIEQAALLANGTMTAHARALGKETEVSATGTDHLAGRMAASPLPIETAAALTPPQTTEPVAKHAPTLAKRLEASRRGVPYRQVAATLFLFVVTGAGIAGMTQMQDVLNSASLLTLSTEWAQTIRR